MDLNEARKKNWKITGLEKLIEFLEKDIGKLPSELRDVLEDPGLDGRGVNSMLEKLGSQYRIKQISKPSGPVRDKMATGENEEVLHKYHVTTNDVGDEVKIGYMQSVPKKNKPMVEEVESDINEINLDEEVEFNLDENVQSALDKMTDLSEEAQTEVKDLIEAAVADRVQKKEQELKEDFDKKLQEKEEQLIEDVDNYLTYAAEEWKRENQIALEQGARAEISENLIKDLKAVFENHNIDLPEEKVDQVEELKKEINELKGKVNEKHDENKNLKEQLETAKREDIIDELSEGLAQTEYDRFKQLTEDLSFVSEDRFRQKAQTVLETYFSKNNEKETVEEEEIPKDEEGNPLAKQALKYL